MKAGLEDQDCYIFVAVRFSLFHLDLFCIRMARPGRSPGAHGGHRSRSNLHLSKYRSWGHFHLQGTRGPRFPLMYRPTSCEVLRLDVPISFPSFAQRSRMLDTYRQLRAFICAAI